MIEILTDPIVQDSVRVTDFIDKESFRGVFGFNEAVWLFVGYAAHKFVDVILSYIRLRWIVPLQKAKGVDRPGRKK